MKRITSILIVLGVIFIYVLYGPSLNEEFRYRYNKVAQVRYSLDVDPRFPEQGLRFMAPVDKKFGMVITKLNLNVSVSSNIDDQKPDIYLPALSRGLAHVKGSAYPGEKGAIIIFGQMDDKFYNTGRYNEKFYQIGKLETNDVIDLFFQNKRYQYKVVEKIITPAEQKTLDISKYQDGEYLIMQTGSPIGTIIKRLFVVAKIK